MKCGLGRVWPFYSLSVLFQGKDKTKGKFYAITCHEDTDRTYKHSCTLSLTSALGGGGWLTPRPGRFTPRNDSIPVVQEIKTAGV